MILQHKPTTYLSHNQHNQIFITIVSLVKDLLIKMKILVSRFKHMYDYLDCCGNYFVILVNTYEIDELTFLSERLTKNDLVSNV